MKLLVMSDTHGDAAVIERVKNYHLDVQTVIHCGDSELPYNHPYLQGVERVAGNCDHDPGYVNEIQFTAGELRVFVTHGHLYGVKSSPMNLVYRSKEIQADIVCFGHSHVLGAELIDGTLFVNPGSLLKPRGVAEKSFVVIDISTQQFTVNCYNANNELFDKIVLGR
ncbi:metallophosphoesterase [Solibacillus sp. FSL H8-0538]|uniref:metallophosphoesterase n=1 Tax=Solibacillus sp. FSL H8-0538 TaxID=2921400 RepID=UPI0030F6C081